MVQINQATKQLISVTGGDGSFLSGQSWMFGAAMAALVGLIIIGGIKSIAKVTDKVVPFMVGIYVLGALIVLAASAFGNFHLYTSANNQTAPNPVLMKRIASIGRIGLIVALLGAAIAFN